MGSQKPVYTASYGFTNPLQTVQQPPVVTTYSPSTSNSAELGTIWCNKSTGEYFVAVATANGGTTWAAQSSGTGVFNTVEVTKASGTVLTVDSGDTSLGGALLVTGNLTAHGAVTLATGTNSIAISSDAAATTVGIANGAGAKTLTLGSSNSTSATTLQSASGGLSITSNGGTLGINSGTGSMVISSDAVATTIALGGGAAAKGITIGNTTASTTIALDTPSGTYVIANQGLQLGTSSGPSISFGSGAPSFAAAQGSLYIRTGGTGGSQLLYVNSTGSTTWLAFTAA